MSQGTINLNAGQVTNQHISGALADAIASAKLQHCYKAGSSFNLAVGSTPVTYEEIVYVATGPGTLLGFHALLAVTGSASSMTFDLKKNGVSVLTGVITITNANSNRQVLDASLATVSFADEDVFTMALIVSTSTGAQGPFAWADFQENTLPA